MSEIILPKFMNIGGGKIKSVTDILKKILQLDMKIKKIKSLSKAHTQNMLINPTTL